MRTNRSRGIMISFASVDVSVVFKESLLRNPTGALASLLRKSSVDFI